MVSVSADGKHVAISSPNRFVSAAAPGRVWVYTLNKATNAYAQTAAFTGPTGSNFGIWQQVAPNGKSLAICDAFANLQHGAISIATYSAQQKAFVLTQNNYMPAVAGKTFNFFCSGGQVAAVVRRHMLSLPLSSAYHLHTHTYHRPIHQASPTRPTPSTWPWYVLKRSDGFYPSKSVIRP